MRNVCTTGMCTGCGVCKSICPKGAITILDDINLCYSEIDESKCINCGKCERICPAMHSPEKNKPMLIKQGWVSDELERKKSSSGGIATAIAKAFIKKHGVVCSCIMNGCKAEFWLATSECDVDRFKGSKYVKSSVGSMYTEILSILKNEKPVLFIGLPCQVAGILSATPNKYKDYLYTIDLICHGTPSSTILQRYLNENGVYSNCDDIKFRKKELFNIYVNGKALQPEIHRDLYTELFIKSITYTENCYFCKYAEMNRISDITLGDNWASKLQKHERSKGVSLVLCQTKKGIELIESIDTKLFDVDIECALERNEQLRKPCNIPKERKAFIKCFRKYGSFNRAYARIYPLKYFKMVLKRFIHIKK